MLFWTKLINWLKGSPTDSPSSSTTAIGMAGLVSLTSPATTTVITQMVYATPAVSETVKTEEQVDEPKVRKTRSANTEPKIKKPRAPRKPKADSTTSA